MKRLRTLLFALCLAGSTAAFAQRTHQRFDDDWKFLLVKAPRLDRSDIVEWKWAPLEGKVDTSSDALPSEALLGPESNAKPGDDVFHGRVGYALFQTSLRHNFNVKAGDQRVLHFDSVDDNATVYLNGRKVLHHEGWNDPFDVPLSGWKDGEDNSLDVVVENTAGPGGIGAVRYVTSSADEQPPQAGAGFGDSGWRKVHLPHDFVIEGTFSESEDAGHGALAPNIGWYRKHFALPASARGQSVWLDFDGAFSDAHVWLNGHFLGAHRSGYTGFRFDLNRYAHFGGENVIAVRCDARKEEGWWYEGGGLYRHVWLTIANPVHIAPLGGVYVTTDVQNVGSEHPSATAHVQVTVANTTPRTSPVHLAIGIQSPIGGPALVVKTADVSVPPGEHSFAYSIPLADVRLWSVESPQLYTLGVSLDHDSHGPSRLFENTSTKFGIRTIKFDPDKGFLLNGKPVKLKGTCNHQDFVGVGTGMPDSVLEWRIKKLKEMGSNAYRCSHNEVASELLDACDRLGMLVMDENREFGDTWTGKASPNTTTKDLSDLRQEILRDRNHPSIVIWSLCNEEWSVLSNPAGDRIGRAYYNAVAALDHTRPISAALNGGHGSYLSKVLDLEGFNYSPNEYEKYHEAHPGHPMFGSETASTVTDRGEYADDKVRGYVKAYDGSSMGYNQGAEGAWEPIAREPYNAGGFVWTGFDYKGEPSPYGWPCINSHFGIMDMCGFPKDNYYYYQAWWGDKPLIHIEPHWNWAGKEGQNVNVWCFTNGDEAELFLNGQSLGRKPAPAYEHVEWDVPYGPGTLVAKAYKNGREIASDTVATTGSPYALVLKCDTADLVGDAEGCAMLEVDVVDSAGHLVPDATDLVSFKVSGPAWIAGVGNGDPSCHEPDRASQRHAWHGKCLGIVQSTGGPGAVRVTVSAAGLQPASFNLLASKSDLR
jgi:beta-galactosidase